MKELKKYDYNALANLPALISQDNINEAVANAFEQAKQNGDFKGEPGDDYTLTKEDKDYIANIVLEELPKWTGGSY